MYTLDANKLSELYASGLPISRIAKSLKVDHSVVKRYLKSTGVAMRTPPEQAYTDQALYPELYKNTGRPRFYKLNEHCLDTLTNDSAYVIGLFQSDGNVDIKKYRLRIALKNSDKALLERLLIFFGTDIPLRKVFSREGYASWFLEIRSRPLTEAMARWGVVSPKSHTASTHHSLLLNVDYWRRVMDGDGSLCNDANNRKILSLVGSESICRQFHSFCKLRGMGNTLNVRPHKAIFSLHITGDSALKVAHLLYAQSNIVLDRKYRTYQQWSESQPKINY